MRFETSFPTEPASVAAARAEVRTVARECGLAELKVEDVALAVSEAVTNAVMHARARTITLVAERGAGELLIIVGDDGTGLTPRRDSPGLGLGLPIIARLAKRLEVISGKGRTEIRMVFPCPEAEAA
ncbi:MAG: hypothetical protein NVSMB51_06630 [Solirubrobacteraceae bacterium]